MPGQSSPTKPHDTDDQVVLKAIHDRSGWRVQLHIHSNGACAILEGHARFPDEESCHAHGRALHETIDLAIGILHPDDVPDKPGSN